MKVKEKIISKFEVFYTARGLSNEANANANETEVSVSPAKKEYCGF